MMKWTRQKQSYLHLNVAQKDQCAQHLHLGDHLVAESENSISFRKHLPLNYCDKS